MGREKIAFMGICVLHRYLYLINKQDLSQTFMCMEVKRLSGAMTLLALSVMLHNHSFYSSSFNSKMNCKFIFLFFVYLPYSTVFLYSCITTRNKDLMLKKLFPQQCPSISKTACPWEGQRLVS